MRKNVSDRVKDLVVDIGEAALDSVFFDNFLKEVPVIKTGYIAYEAYNKRKYNQFCNKVDRFFKDINSISEQEKVEFEQRLSSDSDTKSKLSDYIFAMIEKLDSEEKSSILARIFIKFVRQEVTFEELIEMSMFLDKCLISDFNSISAERITSEYSSSSVASRLSGCGILEMAVMPQVRAPNVKNKYDLTDLGYKFAQILEECRKINS